MSENSYYRQTEQFLIVLTKFATQGYMTWTFSQDLLPMQTLNLRGGTLA